MSEQKTVGQEAAEKLRDENVKHGSVNWEKIAAIIDATIKEREVAQPNCSWFDERKEANVIASKSSYDDIYEAAVIAFKKLAAMFMKETPTPVPLPSEQDINALIAEALQEIEDHALASDGKQVFFGKVTAAHYIRTRLVEPLIYRVQGSVAASTDDTKRLRTEWIRERNQLRAILEALPADNIIGTPDTEPASLEWFAEKFGYRCGFPALVEMLRNYAALRRQYTKPIVELYSKLGRMIPPLDAAMADDGRKEEGA
jgi:hypothetical protein